MGTREDAADTRHTASDQTQDRLDAGTTRWRRGTDRPICGCDGVVHGAILQTGDTSGSVALRIKSARAAFREAQKRKGLWMSATSENNWRVGYPVSSARMLLLTCKTSLPLTMFPEGRRHAGFCTSRSHAGRSSVQFTPPICSSSERPASPAPWPPEVQVRRLRGRCDRTGCCPL
jgi:hypothetical protein